MTVGLEKPKNTSSTVRRLAKINDSRISMDMTSTRIRSVAKRTMEMPNMARTKAISGVTDTPNYNRVGYGANTFNLVDMD
jgi:hypothetical protein